MSANFRRTNPSKRSYLSCCRNLSLNCYHKIHMQITWSNLPLTLAKVSAETRFNLQPHSTHSRFCYSKDSKPSSTFFSSGKTLCCTGWSNHTSFNPSIQPILQKDLLHDSSKTAMWWWYVLWMLRAFVVIMRLDCCSVLNAHVKVVSNRCILVIQTLWITPVL